MLTANRSTGERARPTGCGRPSGEGAYAYGSNAAGPRADGVEQESLLAEQRGLGNNLAERRVESAWSEKATGRDSVNATISMRTDFLVGTAASSAKSLELRNMNKPPARILGRAIFSIGGSWHLVS